MKEIQHGRPGEAFPKLEIGSEIDAELLARLDAATTEFFADRETHIRQVARVVTDARAKQNDHRPRPASPETKAAAGR